MATPYSLAMRPRSWSAIWLMRHFELAGFALQQLAADLDGAAALVFVEPVLDLVAGARALDKGEPVAAGLVILLRDDFDDVAGAQLGAQRHHAAVHLGADAGVAHLGVNGVGKIDGRAVGGNHHHLSLGREGVDLVGIEVHLQAGEELVGVGHLLLPLDELANPVEPLLVAGRDELSPALYFQCAAMPSSAMRCISSVRICTSN